MIGPLRSPVARSAFHSVAYRSLGPQIVRWRFCDDVQRSPRLAAAGQCGGRTFQKFEAFDGRNVDRSVETQIPAEAIDEDIRSVVLVTGKAADRLSVPQIAEVVLPGDAAGPIDDIVEPGCGELLDRARIDRSYALRVEQQWSFASGDVAFAFRREVTTISPAFPRSVSAGRALFDLRMRC